MRQVTKLLLFLFLFFPSIPLDGAPDKKVINYGIRKAPEEKVKKYALDSDFDYNRNQVVPVTLKDRFFRWFVRNILEPVFDNTSVTFWDIIKYLLVAAAIALAIYYIINGEKSGLFARSAGGENVHVQRVEEDINTMSFNELISQAMERKEFKTATRYLYLRSLKELSDKKLIAWKPEKTNYDYSKELRATAFDKFFREITYIFEYAWYGDGAINETSFVNIKASFDLFNQQLQPQK